MKETYWINITIEEFLVTIIFLRHSFKLHSNIYYLQEIMPALIWKFQLKPVEKEGNGIVLWGSENNGAVQVIIILLRPSRTLQIAKCLVVFSVAICDKNQYS